MDQLYHGNILESSREGIEHGFIDEILMENNVIDNGELYDPSIPMEQLSYLKDNPYFGYGYGYDFQYGGDVQSGSGGEIYGGDRYNSYGGGGTGDDLSYDEPARKKRRIISGGGEIINIPVYPVLEKISNTENDAQLFKLVVTQNPKPQLVYKRILKPWPTVKLTTIDSNLSHQPSQQLFVRVYLVKSDDDSEVLPYLEGNTPQPVNVGMMCVFKKLKITVATKSSKSRYKLMYRLCYCEDNTYHDLNDENVLSDAIEVFSHSNYLKKPSKGVPPPVVQEVLPNSGTQEGGNRCVILGSSFNKLNTLRVKFGNVVLVPTYHESGTLIVTVPPKSVASQGTASVNISVTNDGKEYTGEITYTYQ